ncbi:MAG: hypothetical protein ABH834_06345 [Candidatus Altiarchaeota archaeon]
MPRKNKKQGFIEGNQQILIAGVLVILFLLSLAIKINIVRFQVPEGVVIDWGDVWSFLTVIEVIRLEHYLPVEDFFFSGIPYVYPPLSLISYALIYGILPFDFIFFANNVAPFIGSFAIFGVFYVAYKLTDDRAVGVLAAYLSMFSTRYMALSGIPIPEMFGHLQAPIFMYLSYLTAKTGRKNHAILTGLAGATLFLNHHLTAGVMFITLSFYFVLLTIVTQDIKKLRLLVIIIAVSFILSSPWWVDTINKNIMNLFVSEGESPIPWSRYIDTGGPHTIYLGAISGILLGLLVVVGFTLTNIAARLKITSKKKIPKILAERQEALTLIFAWCFIPFMAIRSRQIAPILFGSIIEKNPTMLFVFSPIYGTRFFDYIAQPFAIASAIVIMTFIYQLGKIISSTIKNKTIKTFIIPAIALIVLAPLTYSTFLYGFGVEDPILYSLDDSIHKMNVSETSSLGATAKKLGMWDEGRRRVDLNLDAKNWALRSLFPDVNASYEYQASLWMRDNLPANANIVTDYPAGEVVAAGALRKITTGAELRVTVPLSRIYVDVITIYYTPDAMEAVELMKKWGSTHVYISGRMKIRGWFSIERLGRFPGFTNHGLDKAELSKFEISSCFRRVTMPSEFDGKVWLYECTCC